MSEHNVNRRARVRTGPYKGREGVVVGWYPETGEYLLKADSPLYDGAGRGVYVRPKELRIIS